jgi:uncharacterized protein (TIGR03437 family)
VQEEILAHRQNEAARLNEKLLRQVNGLAAVEERKGAGQDIGEIAVLEEDAGIVSRRNLFNLELRTLRFAPSAAGYRVTDSAGSYDVSEQQNGRVVEGLGDDDTREFALEFDFSFYGVRYRRLFVNSDGNVTFEAGDGSSRDRSLGRLLSGLPRIGAFFADLDPARAGSVFVLSRPDRFVVTWLSVPEYTDFGIGPRNTLQLRLLASGAIEFAYADVASVEAVVGLSPGRSSAGNRVVRFSGLAGGESYPAGVAERFRASEEIDTVTVAQRFFETHDDAYDYLAIYNAMGIAPGPGVVAFEATVRNNRTGYGDTLSDFGFEYGSARRLQAVLNMGALGQYPFDPDGILLSRATARDTPTTVLAHEAGHLFLAFASVRDPNNPANPVLLGRQSAHWAFTFNSEASVLEGNRIRDNGVGQRPRFETVAVTEQYSPLDQYLMGFRAKEEVGPLFYVSNSDISSFFPPPPQIGRTFEGTRNDFTVDDLIAVHGRRTPDHTVSQRKFRFATILIVPAGVAVSPSLIEQLEGYRRNFEGFYNRATGQRAVAEATLRKKLELSVWPAAGVLAGREFEATVRIAKAQATVVNVNLRAARGLVEAPAAVSIPAGATSVRFRLRGLRAGVEDLSARASEAGFMEAEAKLQVQEAGRNLRLEIASGDGQTAAGTGFLAAPLVVRVVDENRLPYPGLRILAAAAGDGATEPASALTGEDGTASFRWRPGASPNNRVRFTVEGIAPNDLAATAVAVGRPVVAANGVVNAASFAPGITPLGLHTVFGSGLAARNASTPFPWPEEFEGVSVLVNGQPQPLVFVGENQINFYSPTLITGAQATVAVRNPLGTSASVTTALRAPQPGIFASADGEGAVVRRLNFLEVYATGLGFVGNQNGLQIVLAPVEAFWNGNALPVAFAGLAPGFVGLYQVNVELPAGAAGVNRLRLKVGGVDSNEVRVTLR